MATTVSQAFTEFKQNLELTPTQVSDISTAHNNLRDYLCSQFWTDEDFLTGSYVRRTLLRQTRDVDFFLVLSNDYWFGNNGQSSYGFQTNGHKNLLARVRNVLQARYPDSDIGQDGQAVTVRFARISIDVVPAFLYSASTYVIPNTGAGPDWLLTNPKIHRTKSSELNAAKQGRFVPLVKMIKAWNFGNSYGYSGFFLEMFAYDIFSYHDIAPNGEGIHTFFERAVAWLDRRWNVPDTATGEDLVPRFLNTEKKYELAQLRFDLARLRALNALSASRSASAAEAQYYGGDWLRYLAVSQSNEDAIRAWRELFGGYPFPGYP